MKINITQSKILCVEHKMYGKKYINDVIPKQDFPTNYVFYLQFFFFFCTNRSNYVSIVHTNTFRPFLYIFIQKLYIYENSFENFWK